MNADPTNIEPNEIPNAELQKQKLEFENLEAQNIRLKLQAEELRRSNSWGKRLAPFLPVISVIIGVFGFLWGTYQSRKGENQRGAAANVQRQRENDIREKELAQQINNQYRKDLGQLLQYPTDEKQTLPTAILLISDLNNLIENESLSAEKERKGKEVGNLLVNIITQADFDLNKNRNVEFDRVAMTNCAHYSGRLEIDPRTNALILSRYSLALDNIHVQDTKLIESVIVDGEFFQTVIPTMKQDLLRRFQHLFVSYKHHVHLLKKGLAKATSQDDQAQRSGYLQRAFCWFYASTQNKSLTTDIFQFDSNEINGNWKNCTESFGS